MLTTKGDVLLDDGMDVAAGNDVDAGAPGEGAFGSACGFT